MWSKGNPLLTLLGADQTGGTTTGAADTDTVCSTQYGNSAGGDITYIATCDADSDSDTGRLGVQNRVTLWVDGIYKSGADLGDWQDPCESGCALSIDCNANEDSLVDFNLTLMRQANQGFFDIAVNFQDIFCSAKFDTCYEDGADAGSDEDKITLIHGADQVRDWTGVVGFACSAGTDATQTNLLYGPFTVTCGSNVFAIDPSVSEGNASVAGTTGGLLHYGVYRGTEQLDCGAGAGSCKKLFWNVAFSLQDLEALGGTCTLAVTATANDNNEGFALGLPTAVGVTYPYIDIATTLTTDGAGNCQRNALNVTGSGVQTQYRGNLDGVIAPTAMCNQFNGASVGATGGCAVGPVGFCGNGVQDPGEDCDGGLDCGASCTCTYPWVDDFQTNGCYCDGSPAECGVAVPECITDAVLCPLGTHSSAGECVPNPVGPAGFVYIPPGRFCMGSPIGEVGRDSGNEAQHQVTLTRGFWMQALEVTQGQWQAVWEALLGPGTYGRSLFPNGSAPIDFVTWFSAAAYMNALSASEGLQPCYDLTGCSNTQDGTPQDGSLHECDDWDVSPVADCSGYRFPTEAEWEYAARACTTTATYIGNLTATNCSALDNPALAPIAWFCNVFPYQAVGQLAPNAWGLFDMLGNVQEWVEDWYEGGYATGPITDPTGPLPTGPLTPETRNGWWRVFRGGAYNVSSGFLRAASRNASGPNSSGGYGVGFRPVKSAP